MPNRRPIWLLTALPGLFGMLPVDAHALDCFADGRVTVTGGESTLERHVCDVVAAALPVLAACNLPLSAPLRIDVVDDLPGGCVGLYHCGEDRIEILTPSDPRLHAAITSFRFKGKTSVDDNKAIVKALVEKHGIFAVHRDGVHKGACVRVTPSLYNTPDQCFQLVRALQSLLAET